MKKYADKNRRPLEFQVGDKELLKLTLQIQKQLIGTKVHRALVHTFEGPFKIKKKVGNVAYRLLLPEQTKIYPIFHVSFLRPFYEDVEHSKRFQAKKAFPVVRK